MLLHRTFNTNQRAIKLDVTPQEYTQEWLACWEDCERDLGPLFNMAQPFLKHWAQLLTDDNCPPDIHYSSLWWLLESQPEGASVTIEKWLKKTELYSTVESELTYIYIHHVRTANYFPRKAKPLMAEWVLSQGYKYLLKRFIVHEARSPLDEPLQGNMIEVLTTNDQYPDYFALERIREEPWNAYMFDLLLTGQTTKSMESYTRIPRETYYYEEKELWDLLHRT